MSELFPVEKMKGLSPRMRWMKAHDLHTGTTASRPPHDWAAWQGELSAATERDAVAFGSSEEDALWQLCVKLGLRMWNEPGGTTDE